MIALRVGAPTGIINRVWNGITVMRNLLQDQLLKAGLVKKAKVAEVVREQLRARRGKQPKAPSAEQQAAQRVREERAQRDRELAAKRNEEARAHELTAQAQHIIAQQRITSRGESEYRFVDGKAVRTMLVTPAERDQLARGALVIARDGKTYALLPIEAAVMVRERAAQLIVVDHAQAVQPPAAAQGDDESDAAFYSRFQVPDDLVW